MPTRKLILTRHAHRDTSDRSVDNGLSEKGWKQEKLISKHFMGLLQNELPRNIEFESSPKLRCQETLKGLAKNLSKDLSINPKLDERLADEDAKKFNQRVRSFLHDFEKSEIPTLFACSHGDWIPEAVKIATDVSTQIGKAGWIELGYENDEWKILDLIAHWKDIERLA